MASCCDGKLLRWQAEIALWGTLACCRVLPPFPPLPSLCDLPLTPRLPLPPRSPLPQKGMIYAFNEGNMALWDKPTQDYINSLKVRKEKREENLPLTLRAPRCARHAVRAHSCATQFVAVAGAARCAARAGWQNQQ